MMRLKTTICCAMLGLAVQATAAEPQAPGSALETQSYAIGADLARNLKAQGGALSADALVQGMQDFLAGEKLRLSQQEISRALKMYQVELKRRRAEASRSKGEAPAAQRQSSGDSAVHP